MEKTKDVLRLSKRIEKELEPFSKRVEVVGSIKRGEVHPGDIDIVLIPKDRKRLEEHLKTLGRFLSGGEHESTWEIKGVKVEFYYTNEEEWGAETLSYTGSKGYNIGLRLIAKRKGMKLTQHGLFNSKGKRIAGRTEREIYLHLKKKYKEPKKRI